MEKWKGGIEARDTDSDQLFSLQSKDVYKLGSHSLWLCSTLLLPHASCFSLSSVKLSFTLFKATPGNDNGIRGHTFKMY